MLSWSLLIVLPLAGAGAALWLAYLRWKDRRRPEPLVLVVALAGLGALSVGAALFGYDALEALGRGVSWEALLGPWRIALPAALGIGMVEEGAKALPVAVLALRTRHFDELWDGPIYAAAAGVGFAVVETAVLFASGATNGVETLARVVAAPITHAIFATPWGLGLAFWALRGRGVAFAVGLAVAGALHGLYDLLLARPGLQIAAAVLVGLLWVGLLLLGRRLSQGS